MNNKIRYFHTSMRLSLRVFLCTAMLNGFLFISGSMLAQTIILNNTILDSSVSNAISAYTATMGRSSRLYNGSQYKDDELHDYDTGHPYFHADDWEAGSLFYDGQYYTHVYLMYNIVRDKIIIENPYDNTKIELIKSRIGRFSMAGHDFVNLSGDSSMKSPVRSGFYDVLYDGRVKVYARRNKEMVQKIEMGLEKKNFKERSSYFIYKNEAYYPVRSKASVIRVFYDRKIILRKQISKNRILFRENREHSIMQLARIYDELESAP
jgi:hypothetical protein